MLEARFLKKGTEMAKKKKVVRRAWTKDDLRLLKSMARDKQGVTRIAKALKRSSVPLKPYSRERAALARTEMEYSLTEYWLAEAEEWKQLRQSAPFKGRIANRSSDLAETNNV